tara:strand:+ start:734 stop:1186 length:453 start_codon:yes stop_codon:yes gene_type:complete
LSLSVKEIGELVSLALTIPTVILGVAVVVQWWPAASLAARSRKLLTGSEWFIVGVALSFAGSVVDNLYWSTAWVESFLYGDITATWAFQNGAWTNIVFRQGVGIFAAFCHLRAAELATTPSSRFVNRLLVVAYTACFAFGTALLCMRQEP